MARAQCPECGRFLSETFVTSLAVEPTVCPKCESLLTASHFDETPAGDAGPDGVDEEPAAAAELRADESDLPTPTEPATDVSVEPATDVSVESVVEDGPPPPPPPSVRPPDLDPAQVRDEPDVLADWDRGGASIHDLADRRGSDAPPDAAVVAGAGVAGLLLGMLLSSNRARGGLFGLLAGVLAAAVARRVWELDDQA